MSDSIVGASRRAIIWVIIHWHKAKIKDRRAEKVRREIVKVNVVLLTCFGRKFKA